MNISTISGEDEEWNEQVEPPKKRAAHIRSCCTEGCTSKGYRLLVGGERVQYFPFPLNDHLLCQRWMAAVRLSPEADVRRSFVCSKHFRPGDYKAKVNDDRKKALRRTAIPSLAAVVAPNTPRTPKQEELSDYSTDSSDDEDDEGTREIHTLMKKESADGDNLSIFLVKSVSGKGEDSSKAPVPKVLQHKRLPLMCEELLVNGPPYPWRQQGLGVWLNTRLEAHELQVKKVRESLQELDEQLHSYKLTYEAMIHMLTLFVIKMHMGKINITQTCRDFSTD